MLVVGIWTDGIWAFSTGLDQRVRCWKMESSGKFTEYSHVIISVPEPETLDVVHDRWGFSVCIWFLYDQLSSELSRLLYFLFWRKTIVVFSVQRGNTGLLLLEGECKWLSSCQQKMTRKKYQNDSFFRWDVSSFGVKQDAHQRTGILCGLLQLDQNFEICQTERTQHADL